MNERRLPTFLSRLGRAVRLGWLVAGATLLLFLGLELGYRGQRTLRSRLSPAAPGVDPSQHPNAGKPWWPELQRDLALRRNQFDPYRSHWSLPLTSRYVNIDSMGRRVTPQPRIEGSRRQLFLLGGSVAWGYGARDSATIGAFLAAELRRRELRDVEVVNLAQAAFNSTQEATTLLVELAHGRIPALAVMLDGYNDIATTGKYGEPGHSYGDEGIQQQIDRGRRTFGKELLGLGGYSALVQRLRRALGLQPSAARGRAPASVCGSVAGYYRALVLAEGSLGKEFGFSVVHFLQPHHSVSRKRMTPWEAGLAIPPLGSPCMAALDSAMADHRATSFFSLVELFDRDSATVFVDSDAHLTEAGNERVAQRIAEAIAPLLARGGPVTTRRALPAGSTP